MGIEIIGQVGGTDVQRVAIANGAVRANLMTFGARLTGLWVPDRAAVASDVVLGFDDLAGYLATDAYFGATCGRFGNRIAGGRFRLGDETHQLDCNEGANHLHGGRAGFDRKVWTLADVTAEAVTFAAVSEDGEMGYPGRCAMQVTYRLTARNALHIAMTATTDRATPINMVHHSYFNLGGAGTILDHRLQVNGAFYTPVDDQLLATGAVLPVAGTLFDFRAEKAIGQDISAAGAMGYDHNWALGDAGADLRLCARVHESASGRVMTLHTSEPGVQMYTAGTLSDRVIGKGGRPMGQFAGFTLETQKFPCAPNHAHFPDCILRPGQTYDHRMVLAFSTDG